MKLFLLLALVGMLAVVNCEDDVVADDAVVDDSVEDDAVEDDAVVDDAGDDADKNGASSMQMALLALVPIAAQLF